MVADDRALLCTGSADRRWPPGGVIPHGIPLDAHGYPMNAAVHPHLMNAITDDSLGLVFGHLNEADTIGHDQGPESEAAQACYRETDQLAGAPLAAPGRPGGDPLDVYGRRHRLQPREAPAPAHPITAGAGGR